MPIIITNTPNETLNSIVDNRVSLVDPHTILIKTSQQQGVLLFLDYTKGDETALVISQSIRKDTDPQTNNFYDVIYKDADGALDTFTSKMIKSAKLVYPVAIDFPSDWVKVKFDFQGASSEGTLKVYAKVNNIYL